MPKIVEADLNSVGGRIRLARESAGWTQEKLAAESGFSQGHLSEIELGRVEPLLATVGQLADALSVSPGWLAFGEGAPSVDSKSRSRPAPHLSPPGPEAA
ncbi:MAG: helix-turn-helix transcriptional regulator [Bacilli bacterium]|jgi:transcriptional regulator with XRE-family HTH domain